MSTNVLIVDTSTIQIILLADVQVANRDGWCIVEKSIMRRNGARKMADKVNHPTHYNWFGIECLDVVKHFNFCLGNAIKYIWRAGFKPGEDALDDLAKAKFYIESEMQRIQDGRNRVAGDVKAPMDEWRITRDAVTGLIKSMEGEK
jgi:hypothetical protein